MRAAGGYCRHGAGAEAIWDFDEGQFDGIVMYSYLEHETDVMGVLNGAHRALNPNGSIFIRVPNYGSLNRRAIGPKWCGFRYPDHVNYFTLSTLNDTAERAGFTTHLVNKITRPVDDNISVLLRKSAASAKGN
jgi:2-polyprenyl-3-methyl-5-hydroxy-6-metoxy-1,4-benzoquinol methylase